MCERNQWQWEMSSRNTIEILMTNNNMKYIIIMCIINVILMKY